jgi:outer membrane receptor protein involved in Fe transport
MTSSYGTTIQSARKDQLGNNRNTLTYGLEYRHDTVSNPGTYDSAFYSSTTDKGVGKNIWGVFVQNNLALNEKLIISLAARYDREDIDLLDKLDPTQNKFRRVSHLSPKLGLVFNLSSIFSAYINVAQSFKAPEANTMIYETPGLFSPNPDIDPTVANNYEVGLHVLDKTGNESKVAAYWIDSEREILLNAFATPWAKNENYNTIRRGIEVNFRKLLTEKLSVTGTYTYNNAIFKSGVFEGKQIPLVPQNKYTAQVDYSFWNNFDLRVDWLGVNGQYALNDFNNQYPVSAYNVWNSRLAWSQGDIDMYLIGRNLLNEKYSAFDTSNAAGLVRVNPAPERSILAGVKWEY